jgi:hypothetical protein
MRFLIGSEIAIIGAFTLCTTAMAHDACWSRIERVYLPVQDSPPTYQCVNLFQLVSTSTAQAKADGFTSEGDGRAWDMDIGCEAQVRTAAATGIFFEAYKDYCQVGEVQLTGSTQIQGNANLIGADCAGAALGYQEITSNVLTQPISAALTTSAGETLSGQIGNLQVGQEGLKLGVTIITGLGAGNYRDCDLDHGTVEAQTDLFTYELKSRAYIKVWANSGFLQPDARVRVSMHGSSRSKVILRTRPHNHIP